MIPSEVVTLLHSKSQMHILKLLALNCHVALDNIHLGGFVTAAAWQLGLSSQQWWPSMCDTWCAEVKNHGNLQSCTNDEAAWMSGQSISNTALNSGASENGDT